MASAGTVKVLFSGAPLGKAEGLMKKVEAANKKVGAAALFCVGQFFSPGDPGSDPDDWLVNVVTGDIDVPVPTYFIGGYGSGCDAILEALPASDAKLKYLGRAGVTKVAGLTVAFLDGSYNAAAFHSEPAGSQPPAGAPSRTPYYTAREVQELKNALETLEGEVDILLTNEWPKAVASGVPPNLMPVDLPDAAQQGSAVVAEIVNLARPRYHFAGGLDCHWARLPYTHRDLGAGPRATRFISLAHVDSPSKGKSLHALALVPASDMDPDQLSALPEGSTACPFESRGIKRQAEDQVLPDGQDWRWSMRGGRGRGGRNGGRNGEGGRGPREPPAVIAGRTDLTRDPYATIVARNMPFQATESDIIHFFLQAGKVLDVVRGATSDGRLHSHVTIQFDTKEAAQKALGLHNSEFMGRSITVDPATQSGRKATGPLGQAVDGCWFCLGSASVDLSLIASVGEEAYIALDKGAINDQHVLIVSVDHYPCSAGLPPTSYAEVERYMSALRSMYAAQGKEMVAFERYLTFRKSGGNHCHINVIGIPPSNAGQAAQAFHKAAQAAGFALTAISEPAGAAGAAVGGSSSQLALQGAVGDCEYFMAVLPDGSRLVRPLMRDERWPLNLGRDVLAQLAGCPERADWKACAVSKEEEEQRTEKFKASFKAYDHSLA